MSEAKIRITNISEEYVIVGHEFMPSGLIKILQVPPKSVKEFDLEGVDLKLTLKLYFKELIFTESVPAEPAPKVKVEVKVEVEVSRFELMEI